MLHRLLMLLALAVASPAVAQDDVAAVSTEDEDAVICVAIGVGWTGSHAELREIERVPVPESYRRMFEGGGCASFQLMKETLVDWHLRFGSERSVAAALAYLERAYTREASPPERYRHALERAWRGAQDDLRRASEIPNPRDGSYPPQRRFAQRSETIQRFSGLALGTYGNFQFLAEQYLRAAEEHGSLAMLEKAELYLAAVRSGAEFLAPLEDRPPADGLVYFDLDTFRSDGVEMRAAVLRAQLTRTRETRERAEAILGKHDRPLYRLLGEHAFTGGSDLCDIDAGVSQAELLEAECEADEDALHERVVNFILARAMLDLVAGDVSTFRWGRSFGQAMRLLEAERHYDQTRCCRSLKTDEVLLRLHMARAEFELQRFRTEPRGAVNRDALDELRVTERVATPYGAPTRFRQLARTWLELLSASPAWFNDENGRPPEHDQRYAAYLERTLADLDAIALGQVD